MLYSDVAGDKLSRLGFGLMRFPEKDGKVDRSVALDMVDRAYRGGVNYFDTAYDYQHEDSQVFAREALSRYPRDSYYLADKLPTWLLETEADVMRIFNEQLEVCGVDYFDYYLLHALDDNRWPVCKGTRAYEQMVEQKKAGKIRRLGFSFHGSYQCFCQILEECQWDFVQIQINYLDYSFIDAKALHDKLNEKGIPCMVMEPVRGGFLADIPQVGRQELEKVSGDTNVRWAFRWCLDQKNTPVILSGMSTMAQVEENLSIFAAHTPLTGAEYAALDRAVEEMLKIKTIPCTGCGYCMDCPYGVDIPRVFSIFNSYKLLANEFRACQDYTELGEDHQGSACVSCGACAPMCPQGIAIPQRLAEVHDQLKDLKR